MVSSRELITPWSQVRSLLGPQAASCISRKKPGVSSWGCSGCPGRDHPTGPPWAQGRDERRSAARPRSGGREGGEPRKIGHSPAPPPAGTTAPGLDQDRRRQLRALWRPALDQDALRPRELAPGLASQSASPSRPNGRAPGGLAAPLPRRPARTAYPPRASPVRPSSRRPLIVDADESRSASSSRRRGATFFVVLVADDRLRSSLRWRQERIRAPGPVEIRMNGRSRIACAGGASAIASSGARGRCS